MNELEKLRAQLNQIIDAIIIEAKKSSTLTPSVSSVPVPTVDLSTQIKSAFNSLTNPPVKEKTIFSGYAEPLKWTRNVNCWAKSADLSGTAVCVYGLGGVGGGTLITKKHVLLANHVPYPSIPFTLYFVDNNNASYGYKVVRTTRVGNTDILIGELETTVSDNLKVYSVMPSNYRSYLSSNIPLLYSDQEKKALIGELGVNESIDNSVCITINPPTNPAYAQYFEPVIVGDSGNPAYTIVNNELVLFGAWYRNWYNNSGIATSIPDYIDAINKVLAPDFKLKVADLSGYKKF